MMLCETCCQQHKQIQKWGGRKLKSLDANAINDLVVKFIRLDYDDTINAHMLIMERIYPLDYRAYEVEKRESWWNVF